MDPVELLARNDKWYLGSGDGIIFAPTFPLWLDSPGFWDDATIFQYPFGPLFTISWLDADGRELPARLTRRLWTPAELTADYELGNGITARETRSVQPKGIFASEWTFEAEEPATLHAIAWTQQDTRSLDLGSVAWNGALGFTRRVSDRREVPLDVRVELGVVGDATSWSASLSERTAPQPHWRLAPFGEMWSRGRLPSQVRLEGITNDGQMYAGVHAALPPKTRKGSVAFAMRLVPADDSIRGGRAPTPLGSATIRQGRSETPLSNVAVATARQVPTQPLARASRRRWRELFSQVPHFTCSDPYLERYYWYRWYGLELNSIKGGSGNYRWPTVCEGIGFFHVPITYSAQCHVRELRWMQDPERARGVLRTIFGHQKPNGALHGRIYVNHLQGTDFYHANWGDAFDALDALHTSDTFACEMYPLLSRHAEWLVSTRDSDSTGMFDVLDQYETGQEYMSRYQAVDPRADAYGWENRIRLKGIDVTVYAYALFRTLERLAARVGARGEGLHWGGFAARTARAVREKMWDPELEMFTDVDPRTMRRTGVSAAVSFYPYFTDLATEEHLPGLEQNLLNPSRFWTNYPVPSSPLDDPMFSATGEWKGKRHVCPWNGRVWPMTNSHILDALARWATPERPHLRRATGALLQRFVHMMFHNGDLQRPNCFEHYNPLTGSPSTYRGIDDYQHSWVADLIIRLVAGVDVQRDRIVIDPLPIELDAFELRNLRIDNMDIAVRLDGGFLTVTVNDDLRMGRLGTPVTIPR